MFDILGLLILAGGSCQYPLLAYSRRFEIWYTFQLAE